MTASCETCANYAYDEEYHEYFCDANMDEDEIVKIFGENRAACPYFRPDDEYGLVRHQN